LQLGENAKAIGLLEGPAAKAPEDLALAYVLGMAYLREKKVEEGQRQLDKILSRGETPEALLLLGVSRFSVGDFPNALKDFQKAVAMNAELPTLQMNLGQALMATGDTAGAAKAFANSKRRTGIWRRHCGRDPETSGCATRSRR
jgi:Flp pilus assembly protein TadD